MIPVDCFATILPAMRHSIQCDKVLNHDHIPIFKRGPVLGRK
jgi:hypothetical protein